MTVDRTLTVGHTLREIAARYADHEALVMGSQRYTYAQVLAAACQYANALQRMGLQAGDHVGILMPNCVEYVLLFYACALVGLRPVHLNARYKSADLKYVIQDSDMRILITSAKQREFAAARAEPAAQIGGHGATEREADDDRRPVTDQFDDAGGNQRQIVVRIDIAGYVRRIAKSGQVEREDAIMPRQCLVVAHPMAMRPATAVNQHDIVAGAGYMHHERHAGR